MARLFVFARHAESAANAANVLSSDPSGFVTLTARGRAQDGESVQDALRRYAGVLRRLLAKEEPVTLVVVHELALRYITMAAATGSPPHPGTALKNAVPYLFDGRAVRRAAQLRGQDRGIRAGAVQDLAGEAAAPSPVRASRS
jgi:broad specificity phosphatase PhoE